MPTIYDFRPFVPSNDFARSKAFYEHLGFVINWTQEDICEVDTQFGYRFLLSAKNHNNYAHSLMLHFVVDSAQAWFDHFAEVGLAEAFPEVTVSPPAMQPWGLVVTYVHDPAGVLLHFAEKPAGD